MTWLYFVIPILVLIAVALIYDYRAKKKGQSFNSSFDGTKDQREQNPQAQNDLNQMFNDDIHF